MYRIGMHGIVFSELRQYVESKLGAPAWPHLLKEAGLGSKIFLPVQSYPDEDMVSLVGAATRITGLGAPAILEDFGTFIAPGLLNMYRNLIHKDWRTLTRAS